MKTRNGYTLPEVLVAGSILLTVLGLISGLVSHSARGAAKVGASEEAVRALTIGLEAIKRDVRRIVMLDPAQDIAIAPDGRGLGLRVPRSKSEDLLSFYADVVNYRLSGERLVRQDATGPRTIGGCQLSDIEFKWVKARKDRRCSIFLQVTLLGPPAPKGQPRLTASALLPLTRIPTPIPYKV